MTWEYINSDHFIGLLHVWGAVSGIALAFILSIFTDIKMQGVICIILAGIFLPYLIIFGVMAAVMGISYLVVWIPHKLLGMIRTHLIPFKPIKLGGDDEKIS